PIANRLDGSGVVTFDGALATPEDELADALEDAGGFADPVAEVAVRVTATEDEASVDVVGDVDIAIDPARAVGLALRGDASDVRRIAVGVDEEVVQGDALAVARPHRVPAAD